MEDFAMPFPTSSLVRSGKFKNVHLLGEGGFGKVYYAEENIGRPVAIKEVLPSHPSLQLARIQFEKEARIHARVPHPNIISVYALEEDQQTKELYLICEYANGGSLKDYLKQHGKLTELQAMKVTLDICLALEAVWKEGIVHRDVKPGNILLKLDKDNNIIGAKLGDFGIARDKRERDTTSRYGFGRPGTEAYMAPEQGNPAKPVDIKADIYALGVTLWEMLVVGEERWYKELFTQTSSPLDLRRYNPTIHPGLAAVFRRAVQEDPQRRYPTPQRMADDLQALLEGKDPLDSTLPATPLPPRRSVTTVPTVPLSPPRQSYRGIVITLLSVLVLLSSAIFVAPRLFSQGEQNPNGVISATSISEVTSTDRPPVIIGGAATPDPIPTILPTETLQPTVTPKPPTDTPVVAQPIQAVPKKAPPETYPVNLRFPGFPGYEDWIVTLTNIEVMENSKIRINVVLRNNAPSTETLVCRGAAYEDARFHLMLQDGTRIFPIETKCTSMRDETVYVAPGDSFHNWAIYPALEDATKPFTVVYYSAGSVEGVVLLREDR
jgi:serine/threonine protein kinase